ncbi:unnamed protein product, partial [marine sediment metagenome]
MESNGNLLPPRRGTACLARARTFGRGTACLARARTFGHGTACLARVRTFGHGTARLGAGRRNARPNTCD